MARLDHRAAEDHRSAHQSHGAWRQRVGCLPCRDSVDAGLRLLRQADHDRLGLRPHRPRLDRADEAPRLHAIRGARRRLGRARHGADGRAGAAGIARHPHQHAFRRAGRNSARRSQSGSPPPGLSADEKRAFERLDFFFTHGLSYAQQMANHPQTLYGIADSPVGLAAWFLDHDLLSYELIARAFDGQTRRPHARRRSRQHHAHLADQHGDFRRLVSIGRTSFPSSPRWASTSPLP